MAEGNRFGQRDRAVLGHKSSRLDSLLDARIQHLRADLRRAVESRTGIRPFSGSWRFGGDERNVVHSESMGEDNYAEAD